MQDTEGGQKQEPAEVPPKAAFVYSPRFEQYRYPEDCPFKTTRAPRARHIAASMGFLSAANGVEVQPQDADRGALGKFHTTGYLDALASAARGHHEVGYLRVGLGTPDCPIFPDHGM